VLLAVVVCITGLAASILVAKVLRLDPGFAAGLITKGRAGNGCPRPVIVEQIGTRGSCRK
jgi:hypothetical protein